MYLDTTMHKKKSHGSLISDASRFCCCLFLRTISHVSMVGISIRNHLIGFYMRLWVYGFLNFPFLNDYIANHLWTM